MFANEPRIQHCYLPYDLPCAARRFLDRVQPRLAVIMETELWPNHIHECARRGIPVALANARLSERSAKGYGRFAKLTGPMLAEMSLFAVQTEAEAQRFRDLGGRAPTVEVTGSIKFDLTIDPQLLQRAAELRGQWQAQERPGVDRGQYPRGRRRGGVGGPSSVAGEPSRCLADSGAAPSRTFQCGVRVEPTAGLCHGPSFHGRAGHCLDVSLAGRHHGRIAVSLCLGRQCLRRWAAWCPMAGTTCWNRRRWPSQC